MSFFYEEMIIEDTGCAPDDAVFVENIMRDTIFHSTLDWQSREQLRQGAREALQIFEENRELFENAAREMQAFVTANQGVPIRQTEDWVTPEMIAAETARREAERETKNED